MCHFDICLYVRNIHIHPSCRSPLSPFLISDYLLFGSGPRFLVYSLALLLHVLMGLSVGCTEAATTSSKVLLENGRFFPKRSRRVSTVCLPYIPVGRCYPQMWHQPTHPHPPPSYLLLCFLPDKGSLFRAASPPSSQGHPGLLVATVTWTWAPWCCCCCMLMWLWCACTSHEAHLIEQRNTML